MTLTKPDSVACDAFKSAKWDELTQGRSFPQSAAPTLQLLVQWHAVVMQCIQDLDDAGQVAYSNDVGDIKALPQLSTMKPASAEIRALNKHLGIMDEGEAPIDSASVLQLVRGEREKRAAGA